MDIITHQLTQIEEHSKEITLLEDDHDQDSDLHQIGTILIILIIMDSKEEIHHQYNKYNNKCNNLYNKINNHEDS